MDQNNKPKGEKHLLAEKLAREEANSLAKAYPNLPVDASNNPIASKNHWTPTHGHGGKSALKKTLNITHDKNGKQRADGATLAKGTGPVHNVEGRSFQVHNYASGKGQNRTAFMDKIKPVSGTQTNAAKPGNNPSASKKNGAASNQSFVKGNSRSALAAKSPEKQKSAQKSAASTRSKNNNAPTATRSGSSALQNKEGNRVLAKPSGSAKSSGTAKASAPSTSNSSSSSKGKSR